MYALMYDPNDVVLTCATIGDNIDIPVSTLTPTTNTTPVNRPLYPVRRVPVEAPSSCDPVVWCPQVLRYLCVLGIIVGIFVLIQWWYWW